MISEIRSYLKSSIKLVDSNLKENKSAFYDSDIGETIIDKSYQIEINNIVNNVRTEAFEDEMDINVIIFGHGYRSEISNYDDLLDKAICIRDYITDIKNFSGIETIINIVSNGIGSEQLPGDNSAFKIDINLTLTQAYSKGE